MQRKILTAPFYAVRDGSYPESNHAAFQAPH
jgi:hypothetical protein